LEREPGLALVLRFFQDAKSAMRQSWLLVLFYVHTLRRAPCMRAFLPSSFGHWQGFLTRIRRRRRPETDTVLAFLSRCGSYNIVARQLKNLLVNHIHDRELARCVARYVRGGLLDIGCGTKPYARMVAPYVSSHVGIDHKDTPHDSSRIDRVGSAYAMPAADEEFDSAICTAVLEHLEEPKAALGECFRVLKPGGYAIYSVPFIWHVHEEPRDFFRYSRYGLKYLFEKAGFEIVEIRALSGFWVTFGQLFTYNLHRLNRGPLRLLRIIDAVGLAVQAASYLLDRFDRTEQWTWMYMVVARKPAESPGIHRTVLST
jgi:SAM-dependent methyltransferase